MLFDNLTRYGNHNALLCASDISLKLVAQKQISQIRVNCHLIIRCDVIVVARQRIRKMNAHQCDHQRLETAKIRRI